MSRILVVDDEPGCRRLAMACAERGGHRARESASSAIALAPKEAYLKAVHKAGIEAVLKRGGQAAATPQRQAL